MKLKLLSKIGIIFMTALAFHGTMMSQVGINTTTPQPGAALDIASTDKGVLVPRVSIVNLTSIAPITGGASESLLVYNTNVSTGKGFHYWNGGVWIPIMSDDWKSSGNVGTTPASNFIGTTDNVDLSFRTNNTERIRITNNGRISCFSDGTAANPIFRWNSDTDTGFYRSGSDEITFTTGGNDRFSILSDGRLRANTAGTAANPLFGWTTDPNKGFYSPGADQLGLVTNGVERLRIPNSDQIFGMSSGTNTEPFYSWDGDADTGIWRNAADRLNLTAGGVEFLRLVENANDELVINEDAGDINTRIETINDVNALFVDGANDNVGFGTNAPNTSAQLEMADNNRGILINRVALVSATNPNPVTAPAPGLLVYNTASASSGSTEVLPGFYYWDGSRWVAMGGTGGKDWGLQGNAGTNLAANFLGTTDNIPLSIRTNDLERLRVDAAGTVGIGNLPYTDTGLRVNNSAQPYGIIAETSGAGAAIYAQDSGTGDGVVAISTGGFGTWGQTAASSATIGGAVALGTATNNANGMWSLAGARPTSGGAQNIGVRAVSGSFTSVSPVGYRTVGLDANAIDLGLYALTEGPITTYGNLQSALFKTNYTGSNIDPDSRDPQASLAGYTNASLVGGGNMYYGGYFYSGSSTTSYAYTGATYNGTRYKIIGNGAVSTIVDGANPGDSKKVMFAPEAPEVLFEDYGTGKLENGVAQINIDPIFSENILVDSNHPLKVFIQLEGDCNGVYVTQKTAQGFLVKELQSGSSDVPFSWHIVANRKDVAGSDGTEGSNFSDLRFPDAPSELEQVEGRSNMVEPLQDDAKTHTVANSTSIHK
ncbi:MAG: hypothetical protein HKO54_12170 [Flavobacteriaceae bacterium]|nr:hypothetical protein [Flavobacteriaceae bacterium]